MLIQIILSYFKAVADANNQCVMNADGIQIDYNGSHDLRHNVRCMIIEDELKYSLCISHHCSIIIAACHLVSCYCKG